MTTQLSQIKWVRVALTALVVYLVSFLIVILIVTGYGTLLAFQARGAPDQTMIQAFANQYAPWLGPLSLILLTFAGARLMARRLETAIPLHGIILGAVIGLINLLVDGLGVNSLITLILVIAVAWLSARSVLQPARV